MAAGKFFFMRSWIIGNTGFPMEKSRRQFVRTEVHSRCQVIHPISSHIEDEITIALAGIITIFSAFSSRNMVLILIRIFYKTINMSLNID